MLTAITKKTRISSIDILRGLVMVIMALDHTREFIHIEGLTGSPTNMQTTTPLLFFTRWITHFCAPTFLFLSGISAFMGSQRKTPAEFSSHLLKRGIWFILLDAVLMTFILTFNPGFNMIFLAVLWAFGWSMILLAILVRFSWSTVLIVGMLIIVAHNFLDYLPAVKAGQENIFLKLLLTGPGIGFPLNKEHFVVVAYAILPWAGIMFLGFGFGRLYAEGFDAGRRRKILVRAGLAMILFFIVFRFFNIYGDPAPWSQQKNSIYTFLS